MHVCMHTYTIIRCIDTNICALIVDLRLRWSGTTTTCYRKARSPSNSRDTTCLATRHVADITVNWAIMQNGWHCRRTTAGKWGIVLAPNPDLNDRSTYRPCDPFLHGCEGRHGAAERKRDELPKCDDLRDPALGPYNNSAWLGLQGSTFGYLQYVSIQC